MRPLITTDGRRQHLEGITVCVGVSKLLDVSLSNNKKHFDQILVVTTEYDKETQAVCAKHNVRCVATDACHHRGAKFDKGAAHEVALRLLRHREFVVFFDSDIVLHVDFRNYISSFPLDVDVFYGMDRVNITKPFQVKLLQENNLCGPLDNGWGWGFFQMFHLGSKWLRDKSRICPCEPSKDEPFGLEDYLFRKQFGGPHLFLDNVWYWDLKAQRRLALWCYHLQIPSIDPRPLLRPLDIAANPATLST